MAEQFRSGRPTYPVPPAPPPMLNGADMIRLLTRGAGSAAMAGANYMRTAGPQPVMFPGGVTPPAPVAAPQPAGMGPLSTLPDLAAEAETYGMGAEADSANLMQLIQQAQVDPSPTLRQQIVDMVGKLTANVGTGPAPEGPNRPAMEVFQPQTLFGQDLKSVLGVFDTAGPSPVPGQLPEWVSRARQAVLDAGKGAVNYVAQDRGTAPRGFTGNMPGANMTPAETIAMATKMPEPDNRPGAKGGPPGWWDTNPPGTPAPTPAGAPNPATAPTMGPATPNPLVRPSRIPLPQPGGPPVAAAPVAPPAVPGVPASPQAQAAAAMLSSGQQPPATAAALPALANPQAPAVAAAPAKDRFGLTDETRRNMATIGAMTALGAAQPGATLASALAGGVAGGMQAETARKEKEGASALKNRELNIQEANFRQQTAARIEEIAARREATALASLDRQDAIAARRAASEEMAELRRLQIESDKGNKQAMASLQATIAEGRNNDAAADYINDAIKIATGNGMTPETPEMRSAAEMQAAQAYPNSAMGRRIITREANAAIGKIRNSALPEPEKAQRIKALQQDAARQMGQNTGA